MNEELLTRLIDALESIGSSLSEISISLYNIDNTLDGCISAYGDNRFLCVTGNISTN